LWSQIPENLDILITHGPPKGILDHVKFVNIEEDANVGDARLLHHVKRTLPRIHIFGHIHEGAGSYISDLFTTRFYNVCVCDVDYKPTNPITVFDL
jgi:Icc-related predicted phosphoesterase